MILPVFITVISDHDKPQPPGCLLDKLIKKIEVEEDYEFCVSLDKGNGLHEVRTFKSEREALDAYRILTLYGYTVTIEKKEGND